MDKDCPRVVMDLNAAMAEMVTLLRRMAGERIVLHTQLDPRPGWTEADPREIHWAFVYLAMNATDVTPTGGELTVASARVELDPAAAHEIGVLPGAYLRIEFHVTGAEMKVPAKAQDIIRRAWGAVFQADVDTVTVLIPGAQPNPDATRFAPATRQTGASILVVEDEPAARELMRGMIESAGYQVVEAADGKEAAAVLASREIGLMITDIVMPEQDGFEIIKLARKGYPKLRIIAVSADPDGYHLRAAKLLGAHSVIYKPVTRQMLFDTIRREIGM